MTLTLSLKKKWFDLIKSGVKKEEFRALSEYWVKRLVDKDGNIRKFDRLVFTLGYPKADDAERHMVFENPVIEVRTSEHEEWGAEPEATYFVITWSDLKA